MCVCVCCRTPSTTAAAVWSIGSTATSAHSVPQTSLSVPRPVPCLPRADSWMKPPDTNDATRTPPSNSLYLPPRNGSGQGRRRLFLSFPYVCPEPVLVKRLLIYINGSKRRSPWVGFSGYGCPEPVLATWQMIVFPEEENREQQTASAHAQLFAPP